MTAEEFIRQEFNISQWDNFDDMLTHNDIIHALVEFAKSKVEEAIQSVKENIIVVENMRTNGDEINDISKFNADMDFYIKEESILNAYPLENIK